MSNEQLHSCFRSALGILLAQTLSITRTYAEPVNQRAGSAAVSPATVSVAVKNWEKATGITVDVEARAAVEGAFGDSALRDRLASRGLDAQAQRDILVGAVENYLYDLRDRSTTAATPRRISKRDLENYSVTKFTSTFDEKLQRGPVGRLVVTSQPADAAITIDTEGKGSTTKTFVVSAGSHTVTVTKASPKLACSGGVEVANGATETFCCPRSPCPP